MRKSYLGLKNCKNCDYCHTVSTPLGYPDIEKCKIKHSQINWPSVKGTFCRWFKPNTILKGVLEEYNAI